MRSTQILERTGLAMACGALLLVLGGCPKHENFPAVLDVVVPPTPSSFVITVAPATTDYTFEWEISDPADVKGYRLYLLGLSPGPELLAETTDLLIQQTFASSLKGLQFGVSAVSTGNVESPMTVATAP